jgi:DNA polymerase III epsilon subunit family exonuclease
MTFVVVAISVLLIVVIARLIANGRSAAPAKLELESVNVAIRPVNLAVLPERFIVLDLETTGLRSTEHEIIEVGAIRVNRDSTTHETFQTLVRPSVAVPEKIVRLTGITQQMIDRDGIPLDTAIHSLLDFIGDLPLVVFNAKFDLSFLKRAAGRQGKRIPNRVICALEMSRRAWPGLRSYRLQTLAKLGGLSHNGSHRALADCQSALIVYTSAGSKLGSDC